MKAYKIVELGPRGPRALFHGTNGTRDFPVGQWHRAEQREGVRDGTSKTTYTAGWHVLPTIEDCREYLSRFTQRLDKLVIVECEIAGDIRPKAHSPSPVLLAEWIKVHGVITRRAGRP
jgi:hypothetical protein